MDSAPYILPGFLLVISVIVVFHELGHYWVARLFGTKIDAFSFGFGPRLFGWTDKLGTEWKICLLPLGGYVKFHGDENAASVPDREQLEEIKARMRAEGQDPSRILHLKPLYQRALIVLAGPLANFVLALVIFIGFFTLVGEQSYPVIIDEVVEGSPAAEAGLLPGDRVVSINGWDVVSFQDLILHVQSAPDKPMKFTIERGGATFDVVIRPAAKMIDITDNGRVHQTRGGQIGVRAGQPDHIEILHHDPLSAAARGYHLMVLLIDRTFLYLGDIVTGKSAPDQLGGPVRIAMMSGEAFKAGASQLIVFIAMVSVGVGLLNLFPIPILDGGHLLFYAIEAVQGRPLNHRIQEIGFRIGLALVVLLLLFVTWNDILYLFSGTPLPETP